MNNAQKILMVIIFIILFVILMSMISYTFSGNSYNLSNPSDPQDGSSDPSMLKYNGSVPVILDSSQQTYGEGYMIYHTEKGHLNIYSASTNGVTTIAHGDSKNNVDITDANVFIPTVKPNFPANGMIYYNNDTHTLYGYYNKWNTYGVSSTVSTPATYTTVEHVVLRTLDATTYMDSAYQQNELFMDTNENNGLYIVLNNKVQLLTPNA